MTHISITLLAVVTVAVVRGADPVPEPPSLVVAVNKVNPVGNITGNELRFMFTGEIRLWPDKRKITLVQLDEHSAASRAMMRSIVKMTMPQYRQQMLNMEFRGTEALPLKTLNSSEAACNFIYNVPGAVGVLEESARSIPGCQDRVRFLPAIPVGQASRGHAGGQ